MSRKRTPLALSLFPFLAVLICTMGVLVALLLLVVKQADQTAKTKDTQEITAVLEKIDQVENQLAEAEVRSILLSEERTDISTALETETQQRSYLENEIQKLRQRSDQLAKRITDFANTQQQADDLKHLELTLSLQSNRIQRLNTQKQQLEEENAKTASSGPSPKAAPVYSIVPIAAQTGTDRRPIYIECKEEGLFLHPGGIKLSLDDFVRPMRPGNPLDTALLAYREYWREESKQSSKRTNAYPLLVVRPSGAQWYGIARRAMSSWDDQFGYELIPEDWDVNFGKSDAALTSAVQQAIDAAKIRQQALVAMGRALPASEMESLRSTDSLQANRNVGLTPGVDGGFSANNNGTPYDSDSMIAGNLAGTNQAGGIDPVAALSKDFHGFKSTNANYLDSGKPQGNQPQPNNVAQSGNGFNRLPSQRAGGSSGDSTSIANSLLANSLSANSANRNTAENALSGGSSPGNKQDSLTSGSNREALASDRQTTSATGSASSVADFGSGDASNGHAAQTSTAQTQGKSNGSTPPGQASGNGGGGNTASSGAMGESAVGQTTSLNSQAIANERGNNWALPSRRQHVSAYHRPIEIVIENDYLILRPESGRTNREVIPFGDSIDQAIDPMIDAVWKRVDSWGNLGFDGFWKPILRISGSSDSKIQEQRLETLLQGSGLEVERAGR